MPSPDAVNVRRDLLEWSQPVIADRVSALYDSVLRGDERLAQPMSSHHCRMWRSLLNDQGSQARAYRRELLRLCQVAGLATTTVDEIDRLVLDELMDVVLSRFHRSRDMARAYGKTLMSAATHLAEVRLAA